MIIKKIQYLILICSILLSVCTKTFSQTTIFIENFENAPTTTFTTTQTSISGLNGWSYIPTNYGRLRFAVGTGFYHGGSRAATLDATSTSTTSVNYLIKQFDLSAYVHATNLELSFYFMDHGDETDAGYDEVWVRGDNTKSWISIYQLDPYNKTNGSWNYVSNLDIDSFLSVNNQKPGSTFQIRFGQADNGSATSTTGVEGITFDDIKLTGTPYYGTDIAMSSIDTPLKWITGTHKIAVTCKNMGVDTIKYFDLGYQLDTNTAVKVDSVVCNYLTTGQTFKYSFSSSITLSRGYHSFKVWARKPNKAVPDSNSTNDTIKVNFWTLLNDTIFIDQSGNGNFTTFTDAINAIQQTGVGGPLLVLIRNGSYNERITLDEIPGASSTNTVTFRGINKDYAVLTYYGSSSTNSATVIMNGADYVRFENMTIKNTGTSYGICFYFKNNANHNTISSCKIQCNSNNSTYLSAILASGSESSFSSLANNGFSNTIENNLILGGYYGIRWNGLNYDSLYNITIKKNTFLEQYVYSIYLYYCSGVKIISNTISDPFNSSHSGIFSQYGGADTITANIIYPGNYGIYLYYSNYYDTNRYSLIANNMISNFLNTSNQSGIYLNSLCARIKIFHNSIWLNGSSTSTSNAGINMGTTALGNIIKNNIIISTGSSLVISFTSYATTKLNYNCYYYPASAYYRFYLGGNYYQTLSAFQGNTSYIGTHDANSVDGVDPYLTSISDLHLDQSKFRYLKGDSTGVNFDIDGDSRCNGFVTMGADELPHSLGLNYSFKSYDFDSVPQTYTKYKTLTINNVSCVDTFAFYNITSTDTNFKVNINNFSINPGYSKDVLISFTPPSMMNFSSTLKLYNSKDTITINLSGIGKGIARAIFNSNPVKAFINSCDDSTKVTVYIENKGNENLNLQIFPISGGSVSSLRLLACMYGVDTTWEYPNTMLALNTYFTNYKLTKTFTTIADTLEKYLQKTDVALFPEQEAGNASHFTAYGPKLLDFVNKGGRLVFCGSLNVVSSFNNAGLISGVTTGTSSSTVTSYDTNNPIMKWVPATFPKQNATFFINATDTGFKKYAGYNTSIAVGYKKIGFGDLVYCGFDYYQYSNVEARIITNAISSSHVNFSGIVFNGYNNNSIAVNNKDSFVITFKSKGLKSGLYKLALPLSTNDPFWTNDSLRIEFTVKGVPLIRSYTNNLNFDSIPAYHSSLKFFYLANTGCDTLLIDSFQTLNNCYSAKADKYSVLVGDSVKITVYFKPTVKGKFDDTLKIYNNSKDVVRLVLKGKAYDSPVLYMHSDTVNITFIQCADSTMIPLTIINKGKYNLIYETVAKTTTGSIKKTDSFDPNADATLWDSYTGTASSMCGSNSGTNALYFNASGTREAITKDFNTTATSSINFYLKLGSGSSPCEDVDPGEEVVLQYSTNAGSTWTNINTYLSTSYANFTQVTETLPFAAKANKTRFRWYQLTHSGSGYDNWSLDDVEINFQFGSFLSVGANKDTLVSGDSSIIYLKIKTLKFAEGIYYDYFVIKSNDPYKLTDTVFAKLNLTGKSTIELSKTMVDFGKLLLSLDKLDSLTIYNTGCSDLIVSRIISTNTVFAVSPSSMVIKPNSSGYVYVDFFPYTVGTEYGTVIIQNNDKDTSIDLIGFGGIKENIEVPVKGIYKTIQNCNDSVLITVSVINKGDMDLYLEVYDSGFNCSSLTGIADDFDPSIDNNMWSTVTGTASNSCGANSGVNALYFNNSGTRQAITKDINTLAISNISFALKIASGTAPCEKPETGEEIVLQYSINSGSTWVNIRTYNITSYLTFNTYNENLPSAARTMSTRFRWYQISNSGAGQDNWSIDDISIGTVSPNPVKWLSYSPTKDTVLGNDTNIIYVWLKSEFFKEGLFKGYIVIKSNDKTKPNQTIEVNLTIAPNNNVFIGKLNFGNDISACENVPVTLNAGYDFISYLWNNSSTNRNLTVTKSGMYSVVATTAGMCKYADSIFVYMYLQPNASFKVNDPDQCLKGNNFQFTDQSTISSGTITTYNWNLGDGNLKNGQTMFNYSYKLPGIYNVAFIIESDKNCKDTATAQMVVNANPTIDLGTDKSITTKDSVILDAGAGYNKYLWNTNETTSSIVVKGDSVGIGNHLYFVIAEYSSQCSDTDSVYVNVSKENSITDNEGNIFAKIYPNPANEYVIVELLVVPEREFAISITDMQGKVLTEKNISGNTKLTKYILNVEDYAKGVYMVKLLTDDFIYNEPIFIY